MNTDVTQLLNRIRAGDEAAGGHLLDLVYKELRGLAGGLYAPHRHRNTLQPTALVHEAWMKLAGHLVGLESRRHFFSVAAKAMRQVLADRARAAMRHKRGGQHEKVVLEEGQLADPHAASQLGPMLIDLDAKLTQLAELNPRHAQIVELRLLGSLTMQEIAEELGVSKRTVEDDWTFARAWLQRELLGD